MDFSGWLRNQIEAREMTREQFAANVGVTAATVYLWLGGKARPIGINIVRIARVLGLTRGQVEWHLKRRTAA